LEGTLTSSFQRTFHSVVHKKFGSLSNCYNINPKDEGTKDDRGRDGGTNFILRIKEQEPRLILLEHDNDDDDDD
jgi:hypothetical protein